MNSSTEKLLKDIVGELSFRTMTRREKDKLIARIHEEIDREGFWSKLWNSKAGVFWER